MKIWMAPETLEQWKWSEKSDVWSLGCILLEMLTCHKLDVRIVRRSILIRTQLNWKQIPNKGLEMLFDKTFYNMENVQGECG